MANSGLAITSLVLGIIGICLSWIPLIGLLGGLLAIIAIILGIIAIVKINKTPNTTGKGMAIIGIVLGIISILFSLFYIAVIAYFGVLNPSSFLPTKCMTSTGLTCTEVQIQPTQVVALLVNSDGTAITLNAEPNSISSSPVHCETVNVDVGQGFAPYGGQTIPAGQQFKLRFECTGQIKMSERESIGATLGYSEVGSQLVKSFSLDVLGQPK